MKKLSNLIGLTLMLAMLFSSPAPALAAGRQEALYPDEIVVLGAYEQDGNKSNGPEDIQWRVLEARGDYALLISQDILDARRYNSKRTEVTWEECSLREWLNNDFFESAFSDEEQDAILTTTVDNGREQGNSGWRRSGGNETEDKVFLLSYAELRKYFDKDKERICKPTEYAEYKGVWSDKNGTSHWWLRSPGSSQFYSAYCSCEGKISSTWNTNDSIGVRPVIRIDLNEIEISSLLAGRVDNENNFGTKQILISSNAILALQMDGMITVYPLGEDLDTGDYRFSVSQLEEIALWTDIQELAYAEGASILVGLKKDGSAVAIKADELHYDSGFDYGDISSWSGVVSLVGAPGFVIGITSSGEVVSFGEAYLFDSGYDKPSKLMKGWNDVVQVQAGSQPWGNWATARCADGSILDGGLSYKGDFVDFSSNGYFTVGVRDNGTAEVLVPSVNLERVEEFVTILKNEDNIKEVVTGAAELIWLREDGTIGTYNNFNENLEKELFEERSFLESLHNVKSIRRIGSNAYTWHLAAYLADGKIVFQNMGYNNMPTFQKEISSWENIKQICFADTLEPEKNFVIGLTNDGEIVSAGLDENVLRDPLQ